MISKRWNVEKKFGKWPVLILALALSFQAWAHGGVDSGGGHLVKMPDGELVLADQFVFPVSQPIPPVDGVKLKLDESLKSEIKLALHFMKRYGADQADVFAEQQIFNPSVQFVLSNQLPRHSRCEEKPQLVDVPGNAVVFQGACTYGPMTVLLAEQFARLSLQQKALLLIHERLRSWHVPSELKWVAAVSDGLSEIMSLYQEQKRGETPVLTKDQVRVIERMMSAFGPLGLNTKFEYSPDYLHVQSYGGGVVTGWRLSSMPDGSLYIGVGSILSNLKYRTEPGAKILNSFITSDYGITLSGRSEIVDSHLNMRKISLEAGSRIEGSHVVGVWMKLDSGAVVSGLTAQCDSRISPLCDNKQFFTSFNFNLGPDASLQSVRFGGLNGGGSFTTEIILAAGAKIQNVSLLFPADNQSDQALELKQGAELANVSGGQFLAKSKSADLSLTLDENSKLDFQGRDLSGFCPKGDRFLMKSSTVVSSIAQFSREANDSWVFGPDQSAVCR